MSVTKFDARVSEGPRAGPPNIRRGRAEGIAGLSLGLTLNQRCHLVRETQVTKQYGVLGLFMCGEISQVGIRLGRGQPLWDSKHVLPT